MLMLCCSVHLAAPLVILPVDIHWPVDIFDGVPTSLSEMLHYACWCARITASLYDVQVLPIVHQFTELTFKKIHDILVELNMSH